jgi:hypothetical protein
MSGLHAAHAQHVAIRPATTENVLLDRCVKDAAEAVIVSEMAHWNLARMAVSINICKSVRR